MHFKIVMLFDNNRVDYGLTTGVVAEKYAARHGYSIHIQRSLIDPQISATWNKICALEGHLQEADWLLWLDADALIVNPALQLESLVDQYGAGKNALFSVDEGGLCAGIFLLKNCPWSVQFLKTLLYLGNTNAVKCAHEQGTIQHLFDNYPSVTTQLGAIPEELILNPHSCFSEKAFIMHYWSNTLSFPVVRPYIENINRHGWKREYWISLGGRRSDGKPSGNSPV